MQWRAVHTKKLCQTFALLLVCLNGCGTGSTVLEEVVEQVHTVEPNADINIYNRDGAVLVYGSDENEMWVQCTKKAYSRERLNGIAIDVSTKPGTVSVVAKFPPRSKWAFSDHSGTVDCTIVVPATASISALDLNAGEVLVDSLRGQLLRARLNDGRMFARNCFANLDLTLKRGTLGLSYDWWEKEKFSAQVKLAQGNAWVWLPAAAAFHLIADAAHGKIANDFNDQPVSANPSSKGMKLDQIINGGGRATIQVRVDKGDIKIAEANP